MTTEMLIQLIADGLRTAVREGWSHTFLCDFHGDFQIVPASRTTRRHEIFFSYPLARLRRGLSQSELEYIIARIYHFYL